MIQRYDIVIDINLSDDAAGMERQECGEFIKYDDAMFIINQLKDGLKHLRDCNVSMNSPDDLNIYVRNLLESVE